MIRTEERGHDDRQVGGNDGERGNVPVLEDHSFEFQVAGFAAG